MHAHAIPQRLWYYLAHLSKWYHFHMFSIFSVTPQSTEKHVFSVKKRDHFQIGTIIKAQKKCLRDHCSVWEVLWFFFTCFNFETPRIKLKNKQTKKEMVALFLLKHRFQRKTIKTNCIDPLHGVHVYEQLGHSPVCCYRVIAVLPV